MNAQEWSLISPNCPYCGRECVSRKAFAAHVSRCLSKKKSPSWMKDQMRMYGFKWNDKFDDRLWLERLLYEWKAMKANFFSQKRFFEKVIERKDVDERLGT